MSRPSINSLSILAATDPKGLAKAALKYGIVVQGRYSSDPLNRTVQEEKIRALVSEISDKKRSRETLQVKQLCESYGYITGFLAESAGAAYTYTYDDVPLSDNPEIRGEVEYSYDISSFGEHIPQTLEVPEEYPELEVTDVDCTIVSAVDSNGTEVPGAIDNQLFKNNALKFFWDNLHDAAVENADDRQEDSGYDEYDEYSPY